VWKRACVRACVWGGGEEGGNVKLTKQTHTHIHITFTPQSPLQSLQISTKFSHNHPRIQIICIQFFCLLFSRTKRNKKMEVVTRQNSFARSLSLSHKYIWKDNLTVQHGQLDQTPTSNTESWTTVNGQIDCAQVILESISILICAASTSKIKTLF
jgi:hypothetical protein